MYILKSTECDWSMAWSSDLSLESMAGIASENPDLYARLERFFNSFKGKSRKEFGKGGYETYWNVPVGLILKKES